jgi:hypothetical protein
MILVTGLTLPNCCVCPKLLSRFPSPSVVSIFKTLRFKREVVHMIIFDYTIVIHHYCFIFRSFYYDKLWSHEYSC